MLISPVCSCPRLPALVLAAGLLAACAPPGPPEPSGGSTLGTVYTVKYAKLPPALGPADLQA